MIRGALAWLRRRPVVWLVALLLFPIGFSLATMPPSMPRYANVRADWQASDAWLRDRNGRLLDTMVPNIRKTSDLVQEITAASEEQSSGVNQINVAMTQLSQTTQQNASSSEELAATAEEMSTQAEQLQQPMAFFKLAGTAHARVAGAAIASAGRKAMYGRPAPRHPGTPSARGAAPNFAEAAADGQPDEAHFGRF